MIVNISSGIASVPFPLYTLYAASKVSMAENTNMNLLNTLTNPQGCLFNFFYLSQIFVERFSQGLQAEYENRGILIQVVNFRPQVSLRLCSHRAFDTRSLNAGY